MVESPSLLIKYQHIGLVAQQSSILQNCLLHLESFSSKKAKHLLICENFLLLFYITVNLIYLGFWIKQTNLLVLGCGHFSLFIGIFIDQTIYRLI